jgi:hypothetical protein
MASNRFDNLSSNVFDVCGKVMGYDASWTPSTGGAALTARVLFGEPTMNDKLGEYGDNYTLRTFFMEYYQGSFLTLFENVQEDKEELVVITIDDIQRNFYVVNEESKYDGRNYRVKLNERV